MTYTHMRINSSINLNEINFNVHGVPSWMVILKLTKIGAHRLYDISNDSDNRPSRRKNSCSYGVWRTVVKVVWIV